MILLLGGTSETAGIAAGLADAGYLVLVSTATDAELDVGNRPGIARRIGRLSQEDMLSLVRDRSIRAIIDGTHPYAVAVRAAAIWAAAQAGVPYLTFIRPAIGQANGNVIIASDHEEAAILSFSKRMPVLLTTGTRNLEPYIRESIRTSTPVIVRILDHPESISASRSVGLREDQLIIGRGPFTVDENRSAIRTYGIKTLVTKDSGKAGGVHEKLEAAIKEGCRVVIVERPALTSDGAFENVQDFVAAVIKKVPSRFKYADSQ
ncbi:MAG: precorrin-6A reductase [Armatimonadota bacterium]